MTQSENLAGLARINRELVSKAEAIDSTRRVVLDMDSTEIPVYGQQQASAYNGHFKSTYYHSLLLPEIDRQRLWQLFSYVLSRSRRLWYKP